MKKFKTYFLITTISLIVTIYLFEGYLNINSSLRQVSTKKKENILYKKNMKYDSRTKLKIKKKIKKKNKNVTVTISPSTFNDPQKNYIFLLENLSPTRLVVMKMVIILHTQVIDSALII